MEIKTVVGLVCFFKRKVVDCSKIFMYKAHHSLRFHSFGMDSVLEDDSIFMAISIYSICGGLHIFSQSSKRLPYASSGLWDFLYVDLFHPVYQYWRKDNVPPTFLPQDIYNVCLIVHLCQWAETSNIKQV